MTSVPDDNSLSSDQDTNQFLVYTKIELQISYSTIRDFMNRFSYYITKHFIPNNKDYDSCRSSHSAYQTYPNFFLNMI